MIVGIGLEMVKIDPIDAWLAGDGGAFDDVFAPDEITYAEGKRRSGEHLAGRWAAKLAFLKATSLTQAQVGPLSQIEIIRHPSGKPELRLAPAVLQLLEPIGSPTLHLTLSHSGELAVAMVVAEKRKEPTDEAL